MTALLLSPAVASANGRFPTAQEVTFGASGTLVLRATFGAVVSDDGGKTFHYVCEEAMGYGGVAFDPALSVAGDGRILVGLYDGMSVIESDRCTFPRVDSLKNQFVTDLDVDATGTIFSLVTSTGFVETRNGVWRSADAGKTWTALGAGVLGVQFDTVEMAASDTKRVYATGLQISPRRVVMYRSSDGGATLDEVALPIADPIGAYVAAIDRSRPDRVYLRVLVDTPIDSSGTKRRRTLLLRTDDAGKSWTEIARSQGLMLGFALSADGKTIWWGGPDPLDGLRRSTDGGETFVQIGKLHVQCLRQQAGALWVCTQEELDGFALGRSTDGGDSIAPVLHLSEIAGPYACPPDSPETKQCPARWATVRGLFPAYDAGPDTPTPLDASADGDASDAAPADADTLDAAVPENGGVAQAVGCSAGASDVAGLGIDVIGVSGGLLALLLARRKRRAP